jgi:hypothetical protein
MISLYFVIHIEVVSTNVDVLENITLPCPKSSYKIFLIREKNQPELHYCIFTYYLHNYSKTNILQGTLADSRFDAFSPVIMYRRF